MRKHLLALAELGDSSGGSATVNDEQPGSEQHSCVEEPNDVSPRASSLLGEFLGQQWHAEMSTKSGEHGDLGGNE